MSSQYHNQSFHSDKSQQSLNHSFQQYQKQAIIAFPFHLQQNLSFNNSNSDFVITLEASEERLTIIVEDRFDIKMWRGDFTSKYIEEITRKTGKERTYLTFLQMIVGTIQTQKGFSQFYIDLMGFNELQLLKARRGGEDNFQSAKNNKKYLILTHVISGSSGSNANKVHYPLPLSPVETGTYLMDKETMQRMVKRMSQTLTEFKTMGNSSQSSMGGMNIARNTAKEFFSKENILHPAVEENLNLKKKLQQLEQTKLMGGGAVSLNNLHVEKGKVEQDFNSYQVITQKEIKKLRLLKQQLQQQIEHTKQEIQSERPHSAYSELSTGNLANQQVNQTMTSNFNAGSLVNNQEVEELRRQLAEVSVELEDTREQHKKRLALQQKDMELYYDELQNHRNEEKEFRVKVNQLENELEHQMKRLDIICKSKGLPRPQRRSTSNASGGGGGTYVSPYRISGGGSQNNSAKRSNNSQKRPSPFRNFNYTPPNKRNGISPSSNLSNGSGNKFKSSPGGTGYSNNTSLRNKQNQSPGARSNQSSGSKKSIGGSTTQNRLYSPSGRVRSGGGSNIYGSNAQNGVVNRVRREPAVGGGGGGAGSRSNSRNRTTTPTAQQQQQNSRVPSYNRTGTIGAGPSNGVTNANRNRSNNRQVGTSQNKNQALQEKRQTTLFGGNNQVKRQTTTILDQQKSGVGGSIDEKIEKLQQMLKMAKNPTNNI